MLKHIEDLNSLCLPQRHCTVFLFSGCLIRKHCHLFVYYFFLTVPFMIVTILLTDFFSLSIFSVFSRFKLFYLYIYSIYKTLSNSACKDQSCVQGAFHLCVSCQDPKRIVVIICACWLVAIKALDLF